MNESNADAPALVRRRRRIARQQREKTPEPLAKASTAVKSQKYSDDESSSTTTTTNENEKRRTNATATILTGSTLRSTKVASNSSGAGSGGHSSNVAYREKILQRRDRGHHHRPTLVRSQSQPREIPPDSPTPEPKIMPSDSSGNVIRFLRKAKRSLSIPRW